MNERGPFPGPRPGPGSETPGFGPASATSGGASESINPSDVAGVDPERLRREVADVLSEPAPTPADRAEQMERAHGLLQRALGGEGGGRG